MTDKTIAGNTRVVWLTIAAVGLLIQTGVSAQATTSEPSTTPTPLDIDLPVAEVASVMATWLIAVIVVIVVIVVGIIVGVVWCCYASRKNNPASQNDATASDAPTQTASRCDGYRALNTGSFFNA